MEYVIIDVETTGLAYNVDRIIEIGAVKIVNDIIVEEFSSLVNPNCAIPKEIVSLTGITEEMLLNQPFLEEIIPDLETFLGNAVLVAHNAEFDKAFLQPHLGFNFQWLDTRALSKILLPCEPSYSLSNLAYVLEIINEPGHRGLVDARTTAELFLYLLKKLRQLELKVLEILFMLSKEQNDSLSLLISQEYLLRTRVFSQEKLSSRTFFVAPQRQNAGIFHEKKNSEKKAFSQLSPEKIENYFKPEGSSVSSVDSYEYRPQQVEMAQAVWESFNQDRDLIVEAGTGTGKSLAYLLPALLWSIETKTRVVISTHTINLQEQLLSKDIPLARDILKKEINAVVVKGRGHYLCLRKWEIWAEQKDLNVWRFMRMLAVWLSFTETGDYNELCLTSRENNEWQRFAAYSDTCYGSKCKYFRGLCFVSRVRKRAEGSQLLIVNHSLLLANAIMEENILPEFKYIIIDEAHHLEKVTEEQLEKGINCSRLLQYLFRLKKSTGMGSKGLLSTILNYIEKYAVTYDLKEEIKKNIKNSLVTAEDCIKYTKEFFSIVGSVFSVEPASGNGISRTVRIMPKHRNSRAWGGISSAGENLILKIQELVKSLTITKENLGNLENEFGLEIPGVYEINILLTTFYEIYLNLKSFVFGLDSNMVFWVEFDRDNSIPVLHSAPIEVNDILSEKLFSSKLSVILTSATLTVKGKFDFFKDSIGMGKIERDLQCLKLESPFRYKEKVIITVPSDLPDPSKVSEMVFVEEVSSAIIKFVNASQGRTLVLFTSHFQLKQVYDRIKIPLQLNGITVFAHGIMGNRAQLLERFKNNHRSVILGTNSFWEGIDVVGEALSSLIIVKLPFWPPSLPTVSARLDKYKSLNIDGFLHYSLPQAIIRFKQGFGRLIRSGTDSGSVCIFDRRIFEKRYGKYFIESLPKVSFIVNETEQLVTTVKEWLEIKNVIN